MTVNQLKSKLNEIDSSQTYSERALSCLNLLEDAVCYIYDKTENKKPKRLPCCN